jgi:HAE1 family hydrophobic/amphiphilic exporter-1
MTLAELSIKRPIFITCIVLAMLVIGVYCYKSLSVDKFPDSSFPTVTISTLYSGAGPSEIETLVTKPLEDELSTLAGLKRLTSTSLEGMSQITAEFKMSVDTRFIEQKVRDKVSKVKPQLPSEVEDPTITKMDPADMPIMKLVLTGDLDDGRLYDVAEQVVTPALERVDNVGSVEISGGRKREIQVTLDRRILHARELSVNMIAERLSASGENIPGGTVNQGDQETTFRSLGEFQTVAEISKTMISLYNNEVSTRISDIGRVSDTLQDETSRVFVNGKKALLIEVYRQSGTNTVKVADGIKGQIANLKTILANQAGRPQIRVLEDASEEVRDNIKDVQETIVIGIVLTIIVVFFFLANGRSTIITGLALPNSLIGSFILMSVAGFSLNVISLMALSLAVGLLIDDAIVVRENIFRKIELGMDAREASIKGTKEVQLAVIATTLVVISTFAPVGMMSGMMGMFMRQFGLTVCFAMLISLFDSLTIAPMLSTYLAIRRSPTQGGKGKKTLWSRTVGWVLALFERLYRWLETGYVGLVSRVVRRPILTLVVSVAIFFAALSALLRVPFNLMPTSDNAQFTVSLEMTPGTNLDAMNRIAKQADDTIRRNPEVQLTELKVGGSHGEAYQASIYVKLLLEKGRKTTTEAMKAKVREQLKGLAAANPQVNNYDPTGGAHTKAFTLHLVSTSQKDLNDYAPKLVARLKQDQRLRDVDSSYRPGKPEIQIRTDLERAKIYGINTKTLGNEIRAQVEGTKAAKFRENGYEYDVRVRLLPEQRDLSKNYDSIYIPNVNQRLVKLTDVANIHKEIGSATIDRQDRGRYIEISAATLPGAGLGDVIRDVNAILKQEIPLPKGISAVYAGESENFQDMLGSMLMAVGMGILFIYLVLASLYESFIMPFTIMLALPLAICGAFVALLITGQSMSIFTFLGLIMLMGVACKNSILLVDYIKRLLQEGENLAEAIVTACKIRLRPILMTSLALIAGMTPVAIGLSATASQRTSMGVAIIGGLVSSTLLTLVVVPAAFIYTHRFEVWLLKLAGKIIGYRATKEKNRN